VSDPLDRIFPMHGEDEMSLAEVGNRIGGHYRPTLPHCSFCGGRAVDHTTSQHAVLFR
jgi:hypothetical protein